MPSVKIKDGKLLIARYGAFGLDGGITDYGVRQISAIALSFRKIVENTEVVIFHHPWRGASESALIFGKFLPRSEIRPCDLLEFDRFRFQDNETHFHHLIGEIFPEFRKGKFVVALCPFDFLWVFASYLPPLLGHRAIGLSQREVSELKIHNGRAIYVNTGDWRGKVLP